MIELKDYILKIMWLIQRFRLLHSEKHTGTIMLNFTGGEISTNVNRPVQMKWNSPFKTKQDLMNMT